MSVWVCTSAIALLSGSAAFAELPRHPAIQTLEATHPEIQPIPDEMPQQLRFGQAVAIRDGTAFAGMPDALGQGRVAIFTQTASGWQRAGTLTAPASVVDSDFGRSLAFRDGYVMVGAANAVYVFKRGNGRWNLSQRLARPAAESASDFARAMHFEAGVLVIGAPNQGSDRRHGTVYVYERNLAGTFALNASLVARDAQIGDAFGFDVSVASSIIVVGAPDSHATGAAYVFRRNVGGGWGQRQRLVSSETQALDGFGWSVAIDQAMIVVGAPFVDVEGIPFGPFTADGHYAGGAAYGFVPTAGQFLETFKLRPRPDANPEYLEFGTDIAMFGKRIVVSATRADINTTPFGVRHTYARNGSIVTALGIADGFTASTSIAVANQWLLEGSPFDFQCTNVGLCIGQATVFDLNRFAQ